MRPRRKCHIGLAVLAGIWAVQAPAPAARAAEAKPRWLAVVASGLVEEVQALADRRARDGFDVRLRVVANAEKSEALLAWVKSQADDAPTAPTCVVLIGDWFAASEGFFVPPAVGQSGRMRDQPTDFPFASSSRLGGPQIAVGRLPARSPGELRAMIAKIVRFEEQAPGPWSNRVNLWVGHPGGNSPIEKKLAETIVHGTIGSKLESIPPKWVVRPLVDFPGTPYSVPGEAFADRVAGDFKEGQCFSVYAGHSGAAGFWSRGRYVIRRELFESLRIEHSPGVFVTTGCYACKLSGREGDGYLVAGMRNPDGPVACIGAFGESYAAHGQLVIDALVTCLASPQASSERLAFSWLAAQRGIARGPIDPLTFWLYDQADGSRGKVPLASQRLEHLEMWTLLGDPALRIPALTPTLKVAVTRAPEEARTIHVAAEFPAEFESGRISIHCQAPTARGLRSEPAFDALSEGSTFEFAAAGRRFNDDLELPMALDDRDLVVRVILSSGARRWLGIGQLRKPAATPALRP